MDKAQILAQLNEYLKRYQADNHGVKTLNFVKTENDFWQRSTVFGHITASAWVVNSSFSKAVLLHHKKLNAWFQPGGHIEEYDRNLAAASLREATEETGLSELVLLSDAIFDIDVHQIPANKAGFPEHFHFDIRFCFVAKDESLKPGVKESAEIEWVDLDKIHTKNSSESILRMLDKINLYKDRNNIGLV